MINIDVAQQLFPNPLTMLTQLCATGVLFYFVRKYLWNTAREMMSKRAEAVQATLIDAEKYLSSAKENQETTKEELKKVRNKSQEILMKSEKEAKDLREELLTQAKKDAERTLEKAREEIAHEKRQMREDMVEEMISVAMSATEKLISEKVNHTQDQKAIERFVKEAGPSA